jgi:peptide-methionine (S)-S-oxide reductase
MSTLQSITLGGGCFWCTEAVFDRVRGVTDVQSGYANGDVAEPTYEQVCTGRTGHAEVVRVTFDPDQIGVRELLEIFFATHDPTTLNRQGNDVGTQYRSGIYYTDPAHRAVAEDMLREMGQDKLFGAPKCSRWRATGLPRTTTRTTTRTIPTRATAPSWCCRRWRNSARLSRAI